MRPLQNITTRLPLAVLLSASLVSICLAQSELVVFEQDTWRSLPIEENTSSVVLGDVDRDGDLDMVFGRMGSGPALYLNNFGRLVNGTVHWQADDSSQTTAMVLGDINGDGWLDLVCGNDSSPLTYYKNNAGTFVSQPELMGGNWPVSDLVLADMDNDHDLDLVIACDGAANRWVPNLDGELRFDLEVLLSETDHTKAIAVGDLNQDGWLDIVSANDSGNSNAHIFYVNQNGDLTLESYVIFGGDGIPTALAMGDVSGDGQLDLVITIGNLGEIRTFVNNGDLTFTLQNINVNGTSFSDLSLADLDRDGLLDIVFTSTLSNSPINWLRNLGDSWGPKVKLLSFPVGYGAFSCLALGDMDEDGDLDLVCASSITTGQSVLWRQGGILEPVASWPPAGSWAAGDKGTTYGLAMVDYDLDGDLDVIQARYGDENAIYLNENGTIGSMPFQRTIEATNATSLVVTDWNNDGFQDLLFSNEGDPVHLHLNLAGEFDPEPTSLTGFVKDTWSLAVADMDNDGHADLIEGSPGEMRISFRNPLGSGFKKTVVVGQTAHDNLYNYLDFADVDQDGDLDFAAALNNGFDVVFQNNFPAGGTVDTLWLSPAAHASSFISLKDVDGEGPLDLTVGYLDPVVENEWFPGEGLGFNTPAWRWGDTQATTWDIELSDWDGDGVDDFLTANTRGANKLFVNQAGFISQADRPAWVSLDTTNTYRLAAGDLDGDGDLDLWVGNRNEPDQIFRGIVNPGPTNPNAIIKPLVPGSPAYLRNIKVVVEHDNQVFVNCEIVDVESDFLTVLARCRPAESSTWFTVEAHDNLQSNPDGLAHQLVFDSSTWPLSQKGYVLQFRTIETAYRLAKSRVAPRYEIPLASAGIRRPDITFSTLHVTMPTLTEGGSVSDSFIVTNEGNETLLISEVSSSRADLSVELPTGASVAPGSSLTLTMTFAPIDTVQNGSIYLSTNDPVNPVSTLMVSTDIRSLSFDFNFLLEDGAEAAPLGESLTGLLAPGDSVEMSEGWLHFRPVGSVEFATIAMSALEENWVVVIPGGQVTEVGIEYYLEVRNGQKTVTDPPEDPLQTAHFLPVTSPRQLTSLVQAHSSMGILAGRDVFVRVVPPAGTLLTDAAVHYRVGGQSEFEMAILEPDSTALIPATAIGPQGLEFYVEANTMTAELRDPVVGEQQIRVNVSNLVEPQEASALQYRMVSVPLDFGDFSGTIADLLTDQNAFGTYDVTRWRCFRYLASQDGYGELSQADLAEEFRPTPGKAFWLIASQNNQLNTAPVVGRSVPIDQPFTVILQPGWNQVGNPFAFPVAWDEVYITDTAGVAQDLLVSTPLAGDLTSLPVLPSFSGFWLKNFHTDELLAHFPPRQYMEPVKSDSSAEVLAWSVVMQAMSNSSNSASATVGVQQEARPGWDFLDHPLPPTAPDQRLRIFLTNNNWQQYDGRYVQDVHPPVITGGLVSGSMGHRWEFSVDLVGSDHGDVAEVQLSFSNLQQLPTGFSALLFDRKLHQSVTLSSGTRYSMIASRSQSWPETGRFELVIGTDDYLKQVAEDLNQEMPRQTVLMQNVPNPFNPATTIRYELSQPGKVRLNIYDLRGQRVRTLVTTHQDVGRYEILWRGQNDQEMPVGAGIYFARLEMAGVVAQTIKLMLVK